MQANSTIHPYHQIVKSKVHINQPFQKPICYYIRIEERKRERGKKRGEKWTHNNTLTFYKPTQNLDYLNVKKGSNKYNSKNRAEYSISGIPEIWTIFEMGRFMEFHLYSILFQFSNLLNSKNRHYFQKIRFVYFQEYFLFLKWTDFWNSNSWNYLVSIPISGIPIIWELHLYQYLAIRVKCEIVPQYLEI